MKRKIWKRIVCAVMVSCLLFGSAITTIAAEPFEEKYDVTPSDTAYSMILSKAGETFIYNKKPVDLTVGKRYYMVYTVEEVTSNELTLNGVAVSQDGNTKYPYTKGELKYSKGSSLFEAGATYFCRIEMTEDGLSYVVAKQGNNETKWIELGTTVSKETKDCKYFGIWLGNKVSARLSNILCYDEEGNNLEIATHTSTGVCTTYEASCMKEKNVQQWYAFSLENASNLAISNVTSTESDTVYISYTVENVKKNQASQTGVGHTAAPKTKYPHTKGLMNFTFCKGSLLIEEGAKYFICAQRKDETLTVVVRKTIDKKDEIFSFNIYTGEANPEARFFYLWFGDGADNSVTADIKDFRFYDKNGKNLGVQTNQSNISITKYGDIEDYSLCEAVYWCENNNSTIVLDDKQNMSVKDEDGQGITRWYKYRVRGAKLTMSSAKGDVVYDYQYSFIKDADGNKYVRLNDTKVTFETGIKGHEGNKVVNVTAANGYKVQKPSDPNVEGYVFSEWCYADGNAFDFNKYVTDSVTVYAKYVDGDGHEYLVSQDGVNIAGHSNSSAQLTVVICSSIIFVTLLVVVLILLKERKKNVANK